uniref:Uncharacterized protein n=1 Tax=Stegastes partitus TaxID=144197 RepID=A0A3B4ZBH0_9TELE
MVKLQNLHTIQRDWSEYIVLTVKHRGRDVMTWGCMSPRGVREMTFIHGAMTACGYTRILTDQMTQSVQKLGT